MTPDLSGFEPESESDERFQRVKRELEDGHSHYDGFPGLRYAKALFRLMCDGAQPWHFRALASAALLYLVIPLDLFPDFLPGGLLDDLGVVVAAVLSLSEQVAPYLKGDEE